MRTIKRLLAFGLAAIFMFSLTSCSWIIEDWWEERTNRTYTVHFNANGGEGEMDDFLVKKGQDGFFPQCEFTKEGYESLAWSTDTEGRSLYGHIPNFTLWLPSSVKDGDTVELYAVWTTPGFEFDIQEMGFLVSAQITEYSGTVKDVIVPSFINFRLDNGIGCCFVMHISSGVFAGHTEMETVKNLNVNEIYDEVFYGCTSLKSIDFRTSDILSVGNQAFYNCSNLQGLDLEATKTIGKEAFYMCTSIKKLVIPKTITEIGADAFYGWTEDQTIEFLGHSENVFGEEWLNGCNANIIWAE